MEELSNTIAFVTPFARAADDETWVSESKRTFVKYDKGQGRATLLKPPRSNRMASIIGCQGTAAGKPSSESRSTHTFDDNYRAIISSKNTEEGKRHARKRDAFSEYVEAKARNPQLAQK
eukprot:TRINITY_DN31692_c0_g1_i1.p1 TRINITY_DN31692_c0_g1~~TRINITY_DN31692_c0_g1_i1.p1  ORF type:complete len:119 (-),score=9.26 TRINITY_DN31692_c0_g1_i1:176-532(-)